MNREGRRRALVVRMVFLLAGLALAGRLAQLQILLHPHYAAMADDQFWQRITIPGERGKIYDRRGEIIAQNRPSLRVEVDLPMVEDKAQLEQALADVLPLSLTEIQGRIERAGVGRTRVMAYSVPATEGVVAALRRLPGVRIDEGYDREYPFGSLGSQVIGSVNVDVVGLEGVEKDYDEQLRGLPGEVLEERTGRIELPAVPEEQKVRARFPIVAGKRKVLREARNGSSVYLTLDMDIQRLVEQVAGEMQQRLKSRSMSVIVMDPNDGDILAMASLPSFDPEKPGSEAEDHPERRIDRNVWWLYEPGSTFKPFVLAAALEEKRVSLTDTFYCPGYRTLGRRRINCWTVGLGKPPHGRLGLMGVIAQSCNVGMMSVVERLGQKKFAEYFHRFGFDERLLENCGSLRAGQVRQPPLPRGDFLGLGFGQGCMVTPLGLATAYCALANGGNLVQPCLVRRIADVESQQQTVFEPQVVRRVVSEATAHTVVSAMVQAVEKGTGSVAKIEGVKVAGKTGTAQKAQKGFGFQPGKNVLSFAGILPADEPRYVILVVADEPKGNWFGATAAAPVAKKIMEGILALERADVEGQKLVSSGISPSETR